LISSCPGDTGAFSFKKFSSRFASGFPGIAEAVRVTTRPHHQCTQLFAVKRHATILVCQRFLRFLFDIVSSFYHLSSRNVLANITETTRIIRL
jgi:hypothetical protein